MAQQTLTHCLYMRRDWTADFSAKAWTPHVLPYMLLDDTEDSIRIGPVLITVDVPDDFDPTAKQVAALQAERARMVAEFTAKLRGIDERLQNLQALTNEVPA